MRIAVHGLHANGRRRGDVTRSKTPVIVKACFVRFLDKILGRDTKISSASVWMHAYPARETLGHEDVPVPLEMKGYYFRWSSTYQEVAVKSLGRTISHKLL